MCSPCHLYYKCYYVALIFAQFLSSFYFNSSSIFSHIFLLNSEKVHEDDIFGRQDILQFFSGESNDYKYLKSP